MATIYRGTISSFYRTNNLMNFYNNIIDGNTTGNSLYLTIGRKEKWAENENDVGFAPPYPYDEPAGYADVWDRSLGFVKIDESSTVAIYPRRDYADPNLGTNSLTFQEGDVVCTNTASYNNSPLSDAGIMVYRCVQIPATGSCSIDNVNTSDELNSRDTCVGLGGIWYGEASPGQDANIPTEKGIAVDTGDGYIWEFLYTIPPEIVISDVTEDYIVVPFPIDIESNRSKWGLGNTVSADNFEDRTIYNIKCTLLQFKIPLTVAQYPDLSDPANNGYRQLSVIYNPTEIRTLYNESNVIAQKEFYLPESLEYNSGEIIYMENRQPIYKSTSQEELITITFQY